MLGFTKLGPLQRRLPATLDGATRTQLQDELLQLHHRFHLITLLVRHDLGEVFKLSQRVFPLDGGRIIQTGTPAEIFLQQQLCGRIHLYARVPAVRHEEVVHILPLLIGQGNIDVIASDNEVAGLRQGDVVSILAKVFSPALFKS